MNSKIYYRWVSTKNRIEFHCSKDCKEVIAGQALSKAIEKKPDNRSAVLRWLADREDEIALFKMENVFLSRDPEAIKAVVDYAEEFSENAKKQQGQSPEPEAQQPGVEP